MLSGPRRHCFAEIATLAEIIVERSRRRDSPPEADSLARGIFLEPFHLFIVGDTPL